jgi:plasmid maintenance system killer protein
MQGLPSEEAMEFLKHRKFDVHRAKARHYFSDQRDYVYATRNKSSLVCNQEWRVILKLHQNKVAEVEPYVFSQCL